MTTFDQRMREIDRQILEEKERASKKRTERRQKHIDVVIERRSGGDRRKTRSKEGDN